MEVKTVNEPPEDTLRDALIRHGIELPGDQIDALDLYCRLLWDWNQRLNLTRHTNYEKFVTRDVIDSMQVARLLSTGASVLDVGTGGGVPGVILAIVRPDLSVQLCESVAKKSAAVDSMLRQLKLSVPVHHVRADQLLKDSRYDDLVARAVGPMWKVLRWVRPHWDSVGRLLLIKGPAWVEERHDARSRGLLRGLQLRRLAVYPMPGTRSESVVLGIWPSAGDGS